MLEKIKSNLSYVFCAMLGFLNFILLAFPYVKVFSKTSYAYGNSSEGVSGYKLLEIWGSDKYYIKDSAKFGGIMSSMLQLFILLFGIALLAYGVMGLLKAFGIFDKFPEKVGNFKSEKIAEYGLFGLAGLNVLLFIFLIIFTALNRDSFSEFGYTAEMGYKLSAGIFIAIIFTVGAVVALKLLEKKLPMLEVGESVSYVCSKCGKKAKTSDKFCNACGGEIEKKTEVREEYACVKCGKKASSKEKFCSSCGGEIKLKEAPSPEAEENQASEALAVENMTKEVTKEVSEETVAAQPTENETAQKE